MKSIPGKGNVLICFLSEADPKLRIQVKVACWEGQEKTAKDCWEKGNNSKEESDPLGTLRSAHMRGFRIQSCTFKD